MKTLLVPALVLAAVTAAALPAAAQSRGHNQPAPHASANAGYGNWQSINVRQANLDRRIDQGIRSGSLSRREATRLRGEFSTLARLENTYRRGGLTAWERTDLDRRFDRLSAQIRVERRDRDNHRG